MKSRVALGFAGLAVVPLVALASLGQPACAAPDAKSPAVGAQYDGAHVYLELDQVEPFVKSFVATFGGAASRLTSTTVTPTPSQANFVAVHTPAGSLSVFAFTTPIPYPFGSERTGYLVDNLDVAVGDAVAAGAGVMVAPYTDPIGRDAILLWPGGVMMQLYSHMTRASAPPLTTIPENRVYVPSENADAFIKAFVDFSKGRVESDDRQAPGIEIGRPADKFRRVRIVSDFGRMTVLATRGWLPYPYGREINGYEVDNLGATLEKAKAAGASVLVGPFRSGDRDTAMVQFPGGYIAEVHAAGR